MNKNYYPRWKHLLGFCMAALTPCLLLTNENAIAQAPVISSVSPNMRIPGMADTIHGNHFNTTAASNIVYYGATVATVTGNQDSTSLYVTVPSGSTFMPVSVLNSARYLMAYQDAQFVPEYDNSCFNSGTFNFKPKVDINTNSSVTSGTATNPYLTAIGDLDGDGKPDLVVANYATNKVMIFRNISSSGSITSSSFMYVDSVVLGGHPTNVKLADLDGDGKLDIICAVYNSIYGVTTSRNLTTGTINFSARRDFQITPTGSSPNSNEVVVADFDGDGRPDIGVVNQGTDSVSILLNQITSPPATSFTAATFAHWVAFGVGTYPSSLCVADFDGDGKTDIAVSNTEDGTISVLKNTSSSTGSVSFSTPSSSPYSVGAAMYSFEVQAADIDGDGKQDLVVTCSNLASGSTVNNLEVLRNTSSGSISFATHSDFSTGTNPLAIAIGDLDGDGLVDIVTSNKGSNNITLFRNTSSSGSITLTSTETLSSGSGPIGVAVGDLDGDNMPDIVVADNGTNTISIYRNNPLPKIDTISGPTTLCLSSAVIDTFKDSISGGIWSVTNSHATINSSNGAVTPISVGLDTVVYTVICNGDTSSIVKAFSVHSATVTLDTITGPTTVCVSNNITLADGTSGGTWGVTASTSSFASITAGGILTGLSVGTAQVTYSVANACGTSPTVTHNVRVTAAAGSITGTLNICSGSSSTLHAASTGGTWASSSYGVATIGAAGIVTGESVGSAIVTYTASGGCYSTATVTVAASPAGISGAGSVCLGLTTTLTDVTTGTWSSSAPTIATIDPSTGIVTGLIAGSATIIYTSSATSCTATRAFTVNPLPAAISGTTTLCVGASTSLSNTSTPGTWVSSRTGVATIASTGSASASLHGISAGTTVVTYTLSATGCIMTDTITVNAMPPAISGRVTVCQGLLDTLSDAGTGTWVSGSTGIATITATGILTGVSAGTTIVTFSSVGTLCSTTYTVAVNASPAAITGYSPLCPGHTATVHDATTSGGWTISNPTLATIGSGTGILNTISGGTDTIVYTLYATGCRAILPINIYAAPAPISGFDTVCNGYRLTLSDATTAGHWSSSDTFVAKVDTTGDVTGWAAGSAIISYTAGVNGCASILNFTVDPILVPSVSITLSTGTTNVCAETSILYTANPVNGGLSPTYVWQVNGITHGTGPTFRYVPANGDIIACTMTSTAPCTTSPTAMTSITMTVDPLLTPSVTLATHVGGDTVCTGSTTLIIPNPVNGGTSPTFKWKVNNVLVWTGATWSYVPTNGDVVTVVMTANVACPLVDTAVDTMILTVSPYVTPSVIMNGSDTACLGYPSVFSATPTNGGFSPTYAWSLNGITSGTGDYYTYNAHTGDIITVTMTSSFPCVTARTVTSAPKTMTVITVPLPSLTMAALPGYIVEAGTSVWFITHAHNVGSAPVYAWFNRGVLIVGQADSVYITDSLSNDDSIVCRVTNTDYCDGITAFAYEKVWIGDNVGVSEINLANTHLDILPNPNMGTFTISGNLATSTSDPVDMEITNVLGQVVYKGKLDAVKGELKGNIQLESGLSNGTYLLNVHTVNMSKVIRFELQR